MMRTVQNRAQQIKFESSVIESFVCLQVKHQFDFTGPYAQDLGDLNRCRYNLRHCSRLDRFKGLKERFEQNREERAACYIHARYRDLHCQSGGSIGYLQVGVQIEIDDKDEELKAELASRRVQVMILKGEVRVRFAPSPTGVLHIGGARTALYNWLFARKHKGKFILRIEDTDQSRSTEESIEAIVSSMKWLGLDWDEGVEVGGPFGPYRQTERLPIYKEAAEELLAKGAAYPCFCTPGELEERRSIAQKEGRPPAYDGRCRNLSKEEAGKPMAGGKEFALRFAMPKEGETVVTDIIRGEVSFQNAVLEDMVIVRQNGLPTYNFAAAIDDAKMDITHIIRGIDHLSNTPKQILLYQALGFTIPKFAHLPMIFGPDKKPLSKRHGSSSVEEYREAGYLPEAIINYLALLGWSLDDKTTIISLDDLIQGFSLERVSKNPAVFDNEKLSWMNGVYIRDFGAAELTRRLIPFWKDAGLLENENDFGPSRLETITTLISERMKTLNEAPGLTRFFFIDEIEIGEEALDKLKGAEDSKGILRVAHAKLENLADFNASEIEAALRAIPGELGVKPKLVFLVARIAATGSEVSPPLFESLEMLGKESSLKRLKMAERLIS